MNIWVIQTTEPLSGIDKNQREFRCGMLSRHIANRSHKITRWASTFNHFTKSHRYQKSTTVTSPHGYDQKLIHGPGYTKNLSLRRIDHYKAEAKTFKAEAKKLPKPDIVFTCIPTNALAYATYKYCTSNNIPYIIDIRDLWPDLYYTVLPKALGPILNLLFSYERHKLRQIFSHASGIVGISNSYLKWGLSFTKQANNPHTAIIPIGYPSTNTNIDFKTKTSIENKAPIAFRPETFVVTFSGTLASAYDFEFIIQTARLMDQQNIRNIYFVIAGSGGKLDALRKKTNGLRNIIFTGWLNSHELSHLLSESNVGLAPYKPTALMSLPNKPFEYMANSLPIINTLNGELHELIEAEEIGLNATTGAPESLRDCILRYHKNKDLLRIHSRNAHQLFKTKYSSETIYPSAVNFIEKVSST